MFCYKKVHSDQVVSTQTPFDNVTKYIFWGITFNKNIRISLKASLLCIISAFMLGLPKPTIVFAGGQSEMKYFLQKT